MGCWFGDMLLLFKYNKGVILLLVVIDIFFLDFYGFNCKKIKLLKKLWKDLKRLYRKVVNIKKKFRIDKGWEFLNWLL